MLGDRQERNWRKCPGGAKPACTTTLEDQKPYVLSVNLQVNNSVVGQGHEQFSIWGDIAPIPPYRHMPGDCLIEIHP